VNDRLQMAAADVPRLQPKGRGVAEKGLTPLTVWQPPRLQSARNTVQCQHGTHGFLRMELWLVKRQAKSLI